MRSLLSQGVLDRGWLRLGLVVLICALGGPLAIVNSASLLRTGQFVPMAEEEEVLSKPRSQSPSTSVSRRHPDRHVVHRGRSEWGILHIQSGQPVRNMDSVNSVTPLIGAGICQRC